MRGDRLLTRAARFKLDQYPIMKKARRKHPSDEMLPEYDFRGAVRGKYNARAIKGTNLVLIAPDVAKYFPDSDSVNEALRACAAIVRSGARRRPRRSRARENRLEHY
jgi:hypothetical protein